eukprot:gene7934-8006_t
MNSAYLYVRVSTDEQKRKGYSLPEQEDRLLRHCEQNNIEVKGIFREDYSAKNFSRPEWQKLLTILKNRKKKDQENVLFIKWDRFSRNIEFAYQMIGILRNVNVQAMAIDQPIDFKIPESTVMLAVYLAVPESENTRRALNTLTGMRRARKAGRCVSSAPKGYHNLSHPDGRKYIAPKQPEAGLMQWVFTELATGNYNGEQDEEMQFVKGQHEPIISEALFYEVQDVLNGNKKKQLAPGIGEHYKKIVMDVFQSEQSTGSDERKMIADQIDEQEKILSNARKRFMMEDIDAEDFKAIKSECSEALRMLEAKLTPKGESNPFSKWFEFRPVRDQENCLKSLRTRIPSKKWFEKRPVWGASKSMI